MPATALIDTSSSMATGSPRRIDLLAGVLNDVLIAYPSVRIVSFNSIVQELTGLEPGRGLKLPSPSGGTELADAINFVADGPKPDRLIIISDGMPTCEAADCFAAARRMVPLTIDAIFVGDDGPAGRAALRFMQTLALMGGRRGISGQRNLADVKALASEIKGLLGGPSR
jgi:hypothetical protein